jgi:hypothetical protein
MAFFNDKLTEQERKYGAVLDNGPINLGSPRRRVLRDENGEILVDKESDFHGDGHVIHFVHVPTKTTCHFAGFLTEFKDNFVSNWNSQTTHGRMDPIGTFKNTQRQISFAWDVPAASVEEAKYNLLQAEILVSMLYPTFEEVNVNSNSSLTTVGKQLVQDVRDSAEASGYSRVVSDSIASSVQGAILESTGGNRNKTVGVMASAPLIKIKFDNLIKSSESGMSGIDAIDSGLTGYVDGFTFSPDLEAGWFGSEFADGIAPNNIVPKLMKFNCNFTVLHTTPHGLGFRTTKDKDKGVKRDPQFPYGANQIERSGKKIVVR